VCEGMIEWLAMMLVCELGHSSRTALLDSRRRTPGCAYVWMHICMDAHMYVCMYVYAFLFYIYIPTLLCMNAPNDTYAHRFINTLHAYIHTKIHSVRRPGTLRIPEVWA
jgi:hypothetical protein